MADEKQDLAPSSTDLIGAVETSGSYVFKVPAETIHIDGVYIPVYGKEFALALTLFRNMSRPLSRACLSKEVWGEEWDPESRTLDAHISQIRKRLSLRPENGFRLSAVYGFGYRLERLSDWEGTSPRGVDRLRPGALRLGPSTTA